MKRPPKKAKSSSPEELILLDKAGRKILPGSFFVCARIEENVPRLFYGKVLSTGKDLRVATIDDTGGTLTLRAKSYLQKPERILVVHDNPIPRDVAIMLNMVQAEKHKPPPLFDVGDAVVLLPKFGGFSTMSGVREYGRVKSKEWNKNLETWDLHIAFYGTKWPKDESKSKTYVLRYLDSSVQKFIPPKPKEKK